MGNLLPLAGDPLDPLRRAREAADACELPLMMHISFGPPSLGEVLPFLKPGDVLTHCFTGHAMKIVDDEGRLLEVAERAWDSGVVFDVGHGTGSFSFETAEAVMAAGRQAGCDLDRPPPVERQRPGLRPADDALEVPAPRDVAARGDRGRDRAARRGARPRRARPGRCGPAHAPTSRCSGSTRARSRCRTSTATCARRGGCCATRPRSSAGGSSSGCRCRRARRGPRSRSGPTCRSRSPRSSGQLHEAGGTPDAMAAVAGERFDG